MKADGEQLGLDLGASGTAAPPSGPRGAGDPLPDPTGSPPDKAARDRIETDLDTNLLVEAGAGSGKTTALVSRMVALVRTGTATVGEIAAVTFTRKAAGELRERFQEALERALLEDGVPLEEQTRLDTGLRQIDRAFMGTIHAFCARLLRERPLEAGIDPGFTETTAPEAELLADRFWTLHLERLAADGRPVLGELKDVGLRPSDLRDAYKALRDYPDVDFPLGEAPAPDPDKVDRTRREIDAILDDALRLMPEKEPVGGWDPLQGRLKSLAYVRSYGRWSDDRVFLDALADLCSRDTWKVVQKKWNRDGKGLSPAAKSLCERVNRVAAPGGAGRSLLELWWAHRYPVAMRFALDAARELQTHRRENGRLDFQDLLTLSAQLLRTRPAARRALGERWRRLLVDEFQDTDPLQAEVLFLLASEPTEDEDGDWTIARPRPGGLFVVGDPKQSIYRFRRADIALYMRVQDRFRDFGAVLQLTANFRSRESVARLVNDVFAPPDGFPGEANATQAAFAALYPQPRAAPPPREGVFHYVVEADDNNNDALSDWEAEALAQWIAERVRAGRSPGDFLILTWRRWPLARYAAALEAHNLPVQVSGAGVSVKEELAELRLLLEALADPDDASRTVAVLIGLFFGLDHEQLLEHALAGRGFDMRRARAGTGAPVEEALATLRRWMGQARTRPADVLVAGLADELGLLAHAAGGELGGVRAGALAFALDAVRRAGLHGDTSVSGALEAVDAALLEEDAEAPLEPGRADVVRVMNLHKAKGLEAKVVVLAGPFGEREHAVERHIARGSDSRARGWLSMVRERGRSKRTLARPAGWDEKERAEKAFAAAEDLRVLYVAATRAEEELVVARHPAKAQKSPWHRFDPWLEANGTVLRLDPAHAPPRDRLEVEPAAMESATEAAAEARAQAGEKSYDFLTVTGLVKGGAAAPEGSPTSAEAQPRPRSDDSGPGGYAWGSAVHGALEAAARGTTGERLRAVGRALLLELDRPARGNEPTELEPLMATVDAVRRSALWKRAEASSRRLAEVPFALAIDDRRWLEGVVDLAFREPDGWVLVDYKTDRGDDPTFETRKRAYRRQLLAYGDAWSQLTGERVKERKILWTRTGVEEAVEPLSEGKEP